MAVGDKASPPQTARFTVIHYREQNVLPESGATNIGMLESYPTAPAHTQALLFELVGQSIFEVSEPDSTCL